MIDIQVFGSSSKGNCYLINDGHTKILIECGIPWKEVQKRTNFQTSNIAACLLSHEHKDHCGGLNDLLRAGINAYMSPGTKEAIRIEHHRIKAVETKKQFQIGTWTILPFDVQHDVSEPFGYLLVNQQGEKLLFATDTYYIRYKFKGLTHLLIECNYSLDILEQNIEEGITPSVMKNRLIKSHFSLENVKEFLKANDLSKVQEIHLLHLSDSNSNEALFKREIQELTGKVVYIA